MALNDGNFEDIPLGVDVVGVPLVHGDDFPGHHADNAPGPPLGKVLRRQPGHMEGVVGLLRQVGIDLRGGELPDSLAVIQLLAFLKDLQDVEILEIVDDHEVRQISGGNGPPVVQQEIPGRVVAGHLYRHDGVHALTDGLPDVEVDVPLLQQVAGMLVVAAEHAAVRVLLRQQGQQGLQVPGGGTLPDHDKLAPLQLGNGVGGVRAFMIGVDPGGDVGIEVIPLQTGGVAVDLLVVGLGGYDLLDDLGVRADDAWIIHHLRQSLHPGVVIEGVDGPVVQHRAALVHGSGGNAGGQHEAHVHGQALGGLEHILDAVGSHDVGDLVGVGDDGGGAVGQHRLDELTGGDHGALQMDVGVDKTREDDLSCHVKLQPAAVLPHADDKPLRHGDVSMAQLAGEDVDIGRVFQYQVRFFPSGGHLYDPQLFAQLTVDSAGIALSTHREILLFRVCDRVNR